MAAPPTLPPITAGPSSPAPSPLFRQRLILCFRRKRQRHDADDKHTAHDHGRGAHRFGIIAENGTAKIAQHGGSDGGDKSAGVVTKRRAGASQVRWKELWEINRI